MASMVKEKRGFGKRPRFGSLREILAYCLVISFGTVLLANFTLFWVFGAVRLGEPNKLILACETAMGIGILVLGFERFVSFVQRNRSATSSRQNTIDRNPVSEGSVTRGMG